MEMDQSEAELVIQDGGVHAMLVNIPPALTENLGSDSRISMATEKYLPYCTFYSITIIQIDKQIFTVSCVSEIMLKIKRIGSEFDLYRIPPSAKGR